MTAQQAHGAGDPLELAHAGDCAWAWDAGSFAKILLSGAENGAA